MMKFIDDTLKDNTGAWDWVRFVAGPACLVGTGIILGHMFVDPLLYAHVLEYVGGLVALWTGYATAVVAHTFAKT